jgi:hypothetical protein
MKEKIGILGILGILILIVAASGCTSSGSTSLNETIVPTGTTDIQDMGDNSFCIQGEVQNNGDNNYKTVDAVLIGYDTSGKEVGRENVTFNNLNAGEGSTYCEYITTKGSKVTKVDFKVVNATPA